MHCDGLNVFPRGRLWDKSLSFSEWLPVLDPSSLDEVEPTPVDELGYTVEVEEEEKRS